MEKVCFKNVIKEVLQDVTSNKNAASIEDNAHIIQELGIDSLGFMQIVLEIEDRTEILIEPELLILDNFETVEKINLLLQSLLISNTKE